MQFKACPDVFVSDEDDTENTQKNSINPMKDHLKMKPSNSFTLGQNGLYRGINQSDSGADI